MLCAKCNFHNSDGMRFCQNCGNSLFGFPQKVVPLEDLENETKTSFGEVPTFVSSKAPEPQTFYARPNNFHGNYSASPKPKSYKTLFLILGGIGVLGVLMAFGGVVALALFSLSQPTKKGVPLLSPTPEVSKNPLKDKETPQPTPKATPVVSFTPPIEPTKKGTFTVYANQKWQLSEINTVPLETYQTRVDGKIDLEGIKTGINSSGVNDAKTKSRRIYPEFPTGALLMRTRYADGNYSNVMAVSANKATGIWQNYPDERGKIEFCINDNSPEQNGGQFTVTVTLLNVPKEKPKR